MEITTIKPSLETLEIMRNFSAINPSIYIREGDVLETLSISNEIMGRAKITETFPMDIPIYEFIKFLNQLKLYSEPVIDVDGDNKRLIIRDSDPEKQMALTRWTFSDPSIIHRPKKKMPVPEADITFTLTKEQLETLLKASGILAFGTIMIEKENDDHISMKVIDMDAREGNQYKMIIPATFTGLLKTVELVFKVDTLKIQNRDYSIAISKKMYSHWHNPDVEYFIALDKRSKFV